MNHLTWVEINTEHLLYNVRTLQSQAQSPIMFIVKANAYGHGIDPIIKTLVQADVETIAVQSIYELNPVRAAGFKGRLVIIGPTEAADISEILRYNAEPTVYRTETLRDFEQALVTENVILPIHVKIETGLHRQGLLIDDIEDFCTTLNACAHIEIAALSTHFANIEDTDDYSFSQSQFNTLEKAQQLFKTHLGYKPLIHAANSGALLMYPEFHGDFVRAGVITYGLYPSSVIADFCNTQGIDFKPVLNWKTKIMHLHDMEEGDTLGYGRTYTAEQKTNIALLPVGYYDGYHRNMRGGNVLVRGVLCPVVGTICMNMMMCDVSQVPGVSMGDEVLLLGDVPGIRAEDLAQNSGTINYEITTQINERIPRILI